MELVKGLGMRPPWTEAGPESGGKCPHERRGHEHTAGRWPWDYGGRDQSDVAESRSTPRAPRSWMRREGPAPGAPGGSRLPSCGPIEAAAGMGAVGRGTCVLHRWAGWPEDRPGAGRPCPPLSVHTCAQVLLLCTLRAPLPRRRLGAASPRWGTTPGGETPLPLAPVLPEPTPAPTAGSAPGPRPRQGSFTRTPWAWAACSRGSLVLGTLDPGLFANSFLCVLRGRARAQVEKEGEPMALYLDFTKAQRRFLTALRTNDVTLLSLVPLAFTGFRALHGQPEELSD